MSCERIKIDYNLLVPATTCDTIAVTYQLKPSCDTISITYKLIGGSTTTIEVEKGSTQTNGKNYYALSIDGLDYVLVWSLVSPVAWKLIGDEGVELLLEEDNPCPFGTYIMEPTSVFETFSVSPTTIPNPVTVEVGSSGTAFGKNFYTFIIGDINAKIEWNGEDSWNLLLFIGAWSTYVYLEEDINCPYGVFYIPSLGATIFEAFEVNPVMIPNPYVESINCYKLAVWSKQCEYSKCVLEYVNNLIFGIDVCKLEESLKEQRRVLEILNCYDPRDILGNTTNYNTITYTKIKQLLNYL
jgi:hypothetical protein